MPKFDEEKDLFKPLIERLASYSYLAGALAIVLALIAVVIATLGQ